MSFFYVFTKFNYFYMGHFKKNTCVAFVCGVLPVAYGTG